MTQPASAAAITSEKAQRLMYERMAATNSLSLFYTETYLSSDG
jgi:hypothetical protein